MATRVVEWKKPYTWWKAISIDENKVISLNLRDENNLIIYDEGDDEIYVDLQLPDWIEPTDAFPVWVTTGRAVVADWWDKAGTIISAKTTSWDEIKVLYADEWTLWIDNWTGAFKQIYFKADVDAITQAIWNYIYANCNTKTFYTGTYDVNLAQAVYDWISQGNYWIIYFNPVQWIKRDVIFPPTTTETGTISSWSYTDVRQTTWGMFYEEDITWTFTVSNWVATSGISFNGTVINNEWRIILSQSTAPSNPLEWTTWYDTTNDQLKVYDWTNWNVTGKEYNAWEWIAIWTEHSDMQWPCPSGFHVPLNTEWQAVYDIWTALGGWSSDWTNFGIALKLPFAGRRKNSSAGVDNQGTYGSYWSSMRNDNNSAYRLYFNSSDIGPQSTLSRTNGCSVRCFKNSPTVPTSSWTKLYWTSIESWWIFWSSTEWLISMSSDWQTWITIADKNLWATTVWNSWDTLSEANCGKYYQRWNNYGFPRTWSVTTSSTQVDASNYWPWNYYSSDTFIKYGWRWDSRDNWNLWWWVTQWTWIWWNTITNTGVLSVNWQTGNVTISGWDVLVSSQTGNILQSWMKIWAWEETDYSNLWTYDNNTLYLTVPDSN